MTHADNLSQLWNVTINDYVNGQIAVVEARVKAAEDALAVAKTENSALKSQNTTLTVDKARLTDENSAKSAQIVSLTTTVQTLQAEIVRLTALLNQTYDLPEGSSAQDIQNYLTSKGENTIVRLPPGEFRLESTFIVKPGQKIVGAGKDRTIFKGSKELSVWTPTTFTDAAGIQRAAWVTSGVLPAAYADAGQCDVNSGDEANPCQKREDTFLDGKRLTRVMQLKNLKLGTVYSDYVANKLYIFDQPSLVEVSRVGYAINTTAGAGRLSGVTVKHFSSASQTGAVVLGGTGWEVDNCRFIDNHASGLHLTQSHSTFVHHSEFTANGQAGMTHHKSNATKVMNNLINLNNTAGYYKRDWESCGFKATYSTGTLFQFNTVVNNNGPGVWFDIDNTEYVIADNVVDQNFSCGIRLEISFTGDILRNQVTRNGFGHAGPGRGSDYSGFATAGIHVNSAGGMGAGVVNIKDNLIGVALIDGVYVAKGYANQNAIHIEQRDRGNSKTWPALPWTTRNVKVANNRINVTRAAGLEGTGVVGLGVLGTTASQVFLPATGNTFENNEYFNTNSSDIQFHCMDGTATNRYRTFDRWQQLGYDKGGKLTIYS